MEHEESRSLGEKLLAQALRAEGLLLPSAELDDPQSIGLWQALTKWSGNRNRGELLVDIGLGRKIATIMAKRLSHLMAERGIRPDAVTLTLNRFGATDGSGDESAAPLPGVIIDGTEGASVQLATCCRPIPGDDIRGYLGRGEGLLVHTTECNTGRRLAERDPERWIEVEWAEEPVGNFETSIKLLVKNGKGALAQVAAAVSSAEADISHIEMDNEPQDDATELRLLLAVRDRQHLAEVLRTLKRAPPVLRASRVKP
jgi:GTP pyrophosphokinase/guanosine-3',5'-bis(diphosphate) 3'-pyrophosphohydrolase